MKIDRLLSMVNILLQKEQVTTPELAEYFEVSQRTIRRDVDDLCMADIPIITKRGVGGGISIVEGYKFDKEMFTREELRNILVALRSLDSIDNTRSTGELIKKISPRDVSVASFRDSIVIDLSSHHNDSLLDKINILKKNIESSYLTTFDYYSDKGVKTRTIEPYYITFIWSAWYVFGYCTSKLDFRLFKLNRLWRLVTEDITFLPRDISSKKYDLDLRFSNLTHQQKMVVLFDKSVEYLLVEAYGIDCYQDDLDDKLRFEQDFTCNDYVINWILGFGEKAEVISPPELKEIIKGKVKKTFEKYFK